jgi:glycosyltransferase involved in cell wall biosynthesis
MDEIVRNCDGVIGRASALGNMAIASAKKLGKPYVREVVGCSFEALWYHGSWLGKLYAPYSFLRARRLTREAPYVVYVTESFLQKRYPTRGKWINCSDVELDDFDDKILERRLRRIDSKTDGEPLILGTIGAVHVRYKGQEGVIRALAKLRQIGLDGFRYEIVGGGDQSYLRKIARKYGVADQVDFLGRITRKEVFQWLDKIDLYIQPSKTEGLPRALIEAMSRGLPCLGTRVGGIPELLTDECLFSRRKTAQALVARLSGLSKDWMKQQAKRNFMESQEYAREAFETRRREFLEQFVSSITACGDSCPSNK